MTRDIFINWMKSFIQTITQRPLLMIFDGHSTHLGLDAIELAHGNDIFLVKLPSHTSARLQPLDVSCFRPMKLAWDKELIGFQRRHNCSSISKSQFVDLLGNIWSSSLAGTNISAGFKQTGIYPLDRSKYHRTVFDCKKLASYDLHSRAMKGISQV
jgi:hypothetical protein